jgi:hypothetical protein
MKKYAKLLTLGLVSIALAAGPVVTAAYAMPDSNSPPPPFLPICSPYVFGVAPAAGAAAGAAPGAVTPGAPVRLALRSDA